jgi:hypothetical protein
MHFSQFLPAYDWIYFDHSSLKAAAAFSLLGESLQRLEGDLSSGAEVQLSR